MPNQVTRCVLLLAGLALLAGCGSSPTEPKSPLVGAWSYHYSAFLETSCAPGTLFQVGCDGGGEIEVTERSGGLSVSGRGGSGCQNCSSVAKFLATLSADGLAVPLRLQLPMCEATIPEPAAGATQAAGTVVCSGNTPGAFTMQRR